MEFGRGFSQFLTVWRVRGFGLLRFLSDPGPNSMAEVQASERVSV
jgi:hypothetical protein